MSKYVSELLPEEFLNSYKNKQPNWGYNGLGFIVYKRTYARLKDDNNTEDWWETVARCVNGAQEIGADYTKEEAQKLYDHIFNLRCNFAGRMLWQLGTDTVKRFGGASLLNCWYTSMTEPEDFCFLFENLMLGGGVGFSVRRADIHELPKIKKGVDIINQDTKDADFIVPDSREGWVSLLRHVLDSFFRTGRGFTYSTVLVRGKGEVIKGFGGTASGPKILIEGIDKIIKVIKKREGKKLRSIDVLDINNIIGSIVVAGNVRRSAQIAIGDPDDHLFLKAKNWGDKKLEIPNWRAMSNNSIDAETFDHIDEKVWNDGYKLDNKTGLAKGEPYGFINIELSKQFGRLIDGPMSKSDLYPTNEDNCQGYNPCLSGDTDIITSNGLEKLEKVVEKVLNDEIIFVLNYNTETDQLEYQQITDAALTKKFANLIQIELENEKTVKLTPEHLVYTQNRGYIKASSLTEKDVLLFMEKRNIIKSKIKKITVIENEDVYDIKVNQNSNFFANGLLVHNCAEISLGDGEACNLCELYLNNIDSKDVMIECAKLLYKTQKAVWLLPFSYPKTQKIIKKNMRIGLGITGICNNIEKIDWCDDVYKELRKFDKQWSNTKGWPCSIKLTTIKPSGTLSLLAGSTPGVHPEYSNYFIRRVRMSSTDSLITVCKELGYHVEYARNFDGTENHDTVIVSFPCKTTDKTILAKDMTAVKQLELVKKLQTYWSDNSVSVTVYYHEHELDEIKQWMSENYETCCKTLSFLLHSKHGFDQAPLEEIDEQKYNEMIKDIKPLNLLSDIDISGETLEGLECLSGVCPVK